MKLYVSAFCIFLFSISNTQSANILFLSISPSFSHQVVFQPIWRELSLRGHKVHAITPNPINDPTLTNLTEIDLSSLYEVLKKSFGSQPDRAQYLLKKPSFLTVFVKDAIMTKIFSQFTETAFNHPKLQEFLKEDHEFDVAIIEWLYPTLAAFGPKYNAPIVGITSLGAPLPALDTVGNPAHPIVAPDHNLPVTRDMPFRERLMSALYAVYVRVYYHLVVLPREDKLARKYLGNDLPYLGDVERNVSLLLLNRNPVIHRVMPVVPAVIELGGIKPVEGLKKKQELDNELKEFLDNSKKGAIYFSLGSNIKSSFLPDEIKKNLIKVFGNLPYNVLWKFEEDNFTDKPKNIMIRKWLPQNEVLAHRNIKLFIMQGGLQSTEEAINSQVPIIGIPFQSDQTANVDTCVHYGMGLLIDLEDLTVERLNSSIYEIITHPSYKENAIRLSTLLYDKPLDGLEKAVWWIEYVIRHKGAPHLRSNSLNIPWYQYLMLDVYGFLLTMLLLILLVVYLILRTMWFVLRKVTRCISGSKDEKKKKQ